MCSPMTDQMLRKQTKNVLCMHNTQTPLQLQLICIWHHRNKQSKCENRNKWGPSDATTHHLMRGSQIWSQNSNRITFDPLFDPKKTQNLAKYPCSIFSTVFCPKGRHMLFDLNFEAKFEILSAFCISNVPACYDFHFFDFFFPCII